MTLTFGSLFAGIGGFDAAFERAGMACRWQVEIDPRCRQVLAHHWPDVERMNDVKKVSRPPAVDLVCGGFPCQDLSVAGRRAGLDGERSGLWFEFLRIIGEVKPQWVVIENVPGLLSSYSGDDPPDNALVGQRRAETEESDLSVIFQGLAQCGYWWAYRVLDAQYWGVPQRRRRVFIVASLGDWRGPAKVLFESESSPWDTAPSREAGARVAGTIAPGAHPGGLNGRDVESGNVVYQCHGSNVGPMGTLRKGDGSVQSGVPFVAGCFTGYTGGPDDNQAQAGHVLPVSFQPRYYTRDNKTGGKPSNTADITNAHKAGDSAPVVAFDWQSGGDVRLNISDEHTSALQKSQTPALMNAYGVRRFTPLECERLQGFPDDWTAIEGMSDSARYKMLGNAVAVPVAQWIGERIMDTARFEHGETP